MRSFFKTFFAALLAFAVFFFILFLIIIGLVASVASKEEVEVNEKSVLTINLSTPYAEHQRNTPFAALGDDGPPTLSETLRLIEHAKTDDNIAGILLDLDGNANGFAASHDLRQAILDFKSSKKFVLAYGNTVSETAYYVGSAADKVYVQPTGNLEWKGLNVTLPFLKGTLEKLDVQTQIFYAGKFKSATEIFRTEKMTPENKLQTIEWLGDIYRHALVQTAASRNLDTATLYRLAADVAIQTPQDAVAAKLIDGAKYDDEVKTEIKNLLKLDRTAKISTVTLTKYKEAADIIQSGKDRIAVIYAEGDIVDGQGDESQIGGERFRALIRKARLDKNVKAIVLRVNSGGGSALASEIIWRELQMAKTEDKKPVVVSFGDVAASGGYYIACGADSIFAAPTTITGSIGVFGIVPNMEGFFKNKLGMTFDGVSTAPYADAGSTVRPLNAKEQQLVQASIDRIYSQFKSRVATGRKRDTAYVETIAQGRVWSGEDGLRIGLVDRIGNLKDAIAAAAKLAKLEKYGVREYPVEQSWFDNFLNKKKDEPAAMLKQELGEETYRLFLQMKKIKAMTGSAQARLPFEIVVK